AIQDIKIADGVPFPLMDALTWRLRRGLRLMWGPDRLRRGFGPIQPPLARHHPDREDEDGTPDDPGSDALAPMLAVAPAQHALVHVGGASRAANAPPHDRPHTTHQALLAARGGTGGLGGAVPSRMKRRCQGPDQPPQTPDRATR